MQWLNKFIKEGMPQKVIKLLDNLLEFYEVHYSDEITNGDVSYSGAAYSSLYKKCREKIGK